MKISQKVIKMTRNMPYKMHISKIKVLAYLQSVAILKVLIIAMLEISESSDYNRVASMIVCKKLFTRSSACMKNVAKNAFDWSDGIGSQFRYPLYLNY